MAARRRISTNLSRHARIGLTLGALWVLGLAHETSVSAFNYIIDANGTYWGIQDAASPRVDTGSIRATQVAPGGRDAAYSTAINGFGGIKVLVLTTTAARLNGELMRGFGLQFDGLDRFSTTQSVDLAGVTISRSVYINRGANWGRWLDTFTNTTNAPLTIKVAFGGQSGVGIGASGGTNHTSVLVKTSSGDAGLNDGGGNKNAFGRRDTPGAANGIPTVVFPAGYNNHGQPINIQLLGRAWDDGKLVGYAYAFGQIANAAGNGHVAATTVPPLLHGNSKKQ